MDRSVGGCWTDISLFTCPGLGLLRKFQQYRRLPQEPGPAPGHHLEEELDRLTCKIDTLLCKIEGQDQDTARVQEEEVTPGRGEDRRLQ